MQETLFTGCSPEQQSHGNHCKSIPPCRKILTCRDPTIIKQKSFNSLERDQTVTYLSLQN